MSTLKRIGGAVAAVALGAAGVLVSLDEETAPLDAGRYMVLAPVARAAAVEECLSGAGLEGGPQLTKRGGGRILGMMALTSQEATAIALDCSELGLQMLRCEGCGLRELETWSGVNLRTAMDP